MHETYPTVKVTILLALACMLGVGLMLSGPACNLGPTPPGNGNANDNDNGNVNINENENVNENENENVNVNENDNVAEVSLYETNVFTTDFARVHGLHTGLYPQCTECHHEESGAVPDAADQACRDCHSDDPAELNNFKEVAHDMDGDDNGCRFCHDDETTDEGDWNCAFCHTALLD